MKSLKGKKILVLGGSAATIHVTKFAKEMGAFVYVIDNNDDGPAKQIADATDIISTTDYKAICDFIKDNSIDGVFAGASEFNIVNSMNVSKLAGLPFYCTKEQWDICQDKRNFKDFCRKYNLPGVPEYSGDNILEIDFPVIVKPVDGCSSRGINICWNTNELNIAKQEALDASKSKKILIEKYINNGGTTIDAKYVAIDGEYYLEAIGDRYVVKGGLITAISFYPSIHYDRWINNVHPYVANAFKSIGLLNGAFFFQAISDNTNIYIYEMGLRVSGGMIYNMTEAATGQNVLKMLIHHTATGQMCEPSDINKINPLFNGKYASTISFPLSVGVISSVNGFNEIKKIPEVIDVTCFYSEGDEIVQKHINTLDQLFARAIIVAESKFELFKILQIIRSIVTIKNQEGKEMILWETYDSIYNEYCCETNI